MTDEQDKVAHRRAIEALRAGVPNSDVVVALGCTQPEIEEKFKGYLQEIKASSHDSSLSRGLLIQGGFGTGKSHLLEYLMHLALEAQFVCSKIVISKETPLYDPVKLFRTAVKAARIPEKRGDALTEIATKLDTRSDIYKDFYIRINQQEKNLDPRFAATVFLYERLYNDPELSNRIIRFWSGEKMGAGELKKYLKACREPVMFKIGSVAEKDLALQRFKFVSLLMRAAGYSGWVLLIDEVELIGRYSLMQRAKSYAQLARWMGRLEDFALPGFITVLTLTDDFTSAVLEDKDDLRKISEKLRMRSGSGDLLLASQAERGMRTIREKSIPLKRPDSKAIDEIYKKIRSIHAAAYGWNPLDVSSVETLGTTRLREHIRKWITEWDLTYLDQGYKPDIEVIEVKQDYSENGDLEVESEDNAEA